jgi:hypothetical protein
MEIASYDIPSTKSNSAVVHNTQYNPDEVVAINMGALEILRKKWNAM